MGDNPDTNVVDRFGFSHEAPNPGILGASVMGTSGARNPTLTAQALQINPSNQTHIPSLFCTDSVPH